MKKKLLIILFAVVSVSTLTAALTACKHGNNNGSKDTEGNTAHTHSYTENVTDPDCAEQGYTVFTCECGETYKDNYTDALGHDIEHHSAKAATCTEVGWNTYETCSRCDYTTYSEISALGHDIETKSA